MQRIDTGKTGDGKAFELKTFYGSGKAFSIYIAEDKTAEYKKEINHQVKFFHNQRFLHVNEYAKAKHDINMINNSKQCGYPTQRGEIIQVGRLRFQLAVLRFGY